MEVICINNKRGEQVSAERLIKEGVTYAASQCPVYRDCYRLAEVPVDPLTGRLVAFTKKRFVPLSNIDETEIAQEREAAILEESMKEMFQPVEMPAEAMDRVWKGIVRELDKMDAL